MTQSAGGSASPRILPGFEEVQKLGNCLADVGLSLPVAEGQELADPIRKVRNVLFRSQLLGKKKFLKIRQNPFCDHFVNSPFICEVRLFRILSIKNEIKASDLSRTFIEYPAAYSVGRFLVFLAGV
jgi:hypothetical protein